MESFGPKRVFVKHTISSRLKCPICFDIFDKPRRLFCGHTFCKKCIRQYLKPHKNPEHVHKCPICRQPIDVQNIGCDLVAKRIIDELKVSCPVNGCPWKGQSQLLETHYHYGCSMKNYISSLPESKSISLIREEEEEKSDQIADEISQNTQRGPLLSRVIAKNPALLKLSRRREADAGIVVTEKIYTSCAKILVTRGTQTRKETARHDHYARAAATKQKHNYEYKKKSSLLGSMLSCKASPRPNRYDQSSSYQQQQPIVPIINLQGSKPRANRPVFDQ